jgi:hypothetical protein
VVLVVGSIVLIGEDVAEPVDAVAPDQFESIEEPLRGADRVDTPAYELLAAVTTFGDERGAVEHRHVLLHCGEAHRVLAGEGAHRVVLAHGSSDDVSARGIGERVEEPVGRLIVEHIYNHLVVG